MSCSQIPFRFSMVLLFFGSGGAESGEVSLVGEIALAEDAGGKGSSGFVVRFGATAPFAT